MKVTVAFLREKNKEFKNKGYSRVVNEGSSKTKSSNKVNLFMDIISICMCLIVLIISLVFFISNLRLSPKILNFATNFRQAEKYDPDIKDIIGVFALYNPKNYLLSDDNIEQIQKAEADSQTENEIIDGNPENALLDKPAEGKKSQIVFSNEEKAVVTEETATLQRISIGQTHILNYSSKRNIDFNDIMSKDVILTKASDKILLYNTHTSESYANSENYVFEYTGTKRTTDASYNMIAIAKELEQNLTYKGFSCTQDTTPHDYGTYTSAYAKSRVTVQNALSQMGGAGISIDVHRDASANLDFAPSVEINGVKVAQCMLVMGVGSDKNPNEYWEDNLRLALRLYKIAEQVYPGLFRPMYIRNSIYNQDLNKYSILIEVGATGNTIEEAQRTTRCISNLLNILYKD